MNSQIVEIKNALRSRFAFVLVASLIPVSLFLKPGFVSVSVIWFSALCVYNAASFEWREVIRYALLLLPLLLYFLYGVGVIYSEDLDASTELLLRKIHLVALPLGFLLAGKKDNTNNLLNTTLIVFLLACLLGAFVCFANGIVNLITHNRIGFDVEGIRYNYFFGYLLTRPLNLDPVYVSLYLNFALLIVLTLEIFGNMVYKVFVSLYLFIFIILCGSNAGIVSAVLIFVSCIHRMASKRFALLLLTGAIAAAIVLSFSIDRHTLKDMVVSSFTFNYSNDEESVIYHRSNKLWIWDSAIGAVANAPVIGYGTADGEEALSNQFREKSLTTELQDELNPHNQFFSTALDIGIPGFLLLAAMMIAPSLLALRRRDKLTLGFMLLVVVFFSIESVLLRQKGIVFFSFFYSLLCCSLIASGKQKRSGRL